jgi:mersacidin/lichenicidin family type 2 lantibiotic
MDIKNIARAWRDDEFRAGLSAEAQASLPDSPVGEIELNDEDLNEALGGTTGLACTASIEISIAVTVEWCISAASGGTCEVQTQGCCGGKGSGSIGQ